MDLGAFLSPQDVAAAKNRTLVVVQLTGGNDGLNTVLPYIQEAYYNARPTLALRKSDVLPLDGNVAFHPNMTALHDLYKGNRSAVVQGVVYPNPHRSHYESMSIWQSASVDNSQSTGWVGRYLDAAKSVDSAINAVNLDALLWPAVI